jgi:PAS domain S-box-containing protein
MNELPLDPSAPTPLYVSHLVRRLRETEEELRKLKSLPAPAATWTAAPLDVMEELRKCQERFDRLFHSARAGMAISTPLGRFLEANSAYCEMLGYTEAELHSLDWASITHPDDLQTNLELRESMLNGQRPSFSMEKRYIKKNGDVMWARISVSSVHEANGEVSTLLVMAEDVTESKKAFARLHRLNLLHTALSKISESIVRVPSRVDLYDIVCRMSVETGQLLMVFVAEVDAERRVAFPVASCGDGLATLLGPAGVISIDEGQTSLGTVGAAVRTGNYQVCNDLEAGPQIEAWQAAALQSGFLATASIPFKSRGVVVGVLALYVGEKDYFSREGMDLITSVANTMTFALEAWEREQQRRQAEARATELADAVKFSDDAILSHDVEGIITSWNKGSEKTFGYTEAEVLGTSYFRLVPEERRDEERQIADQIIYGSEGLDCYETFRRAKDGRVITVSVTASPIRNVGGEIIGVSRVARDITQAKRVEARLRRLVDSNVQGVFFWHLNGTILDCNDAFLSLTGFTREDLRAGRINWSAMTPPEHEHLDRIGIQELAETGVCTPYEKDFIRKDGSRVTILIGSATLEDTLDEGVCFVIDLTEQKKLERQVLQAQKMESIGALAAGVGHDFNNILAVIQMQADLLKSGRDVKQYQEEAADDIINAVERASALTRQLLLFSSREMFQPCDFDLSEATAETLKMVRRILGEHVQVDAKLGSHVLPIHADRGMIDQVLMNLVVNARDAMPSGGTLVIETSRVDIDGSVVPKSPHERLGAFACLSVSDTGCGIPAADLPRIFEPFFTTKDVGKGTGLGLATVFGIVRQHKGWVSAYSELGYGATFRVYLPLLSRQAVPKPTVPKHRVAAGGNETILLVEDDPELRLSVRATLSRLGYHILEARNGPEALQVLKAELQEIHLLLTDMVMPGGMSGTELVERARAQNPQLKAVCMSGYSTELVGRAFPAASAARFLTKPFQAMELAQAVRDALDQGNKPRDA